MLSERRATRTAVVSPHQRRQSKKVPLSTVHHQGRKTSSPVARAPAVAAVAGTSKFGVHESKPPSGTLPPSFTQPIHSLHHHHHQNQHRRQAPLRYGASHPGTRPSPSNLDAAPKVLISVNSSAARGGVSTSLSPQNNGLRQNSAASRKRPRTSPYPYARHNKDEINGILPRDPRLGSLNSTNAFPVEASGVDGGGRGRLWGTTGVPPGAVHPGGGVIPRETEWACPTSSVATSTPSLHDGFSDVFATPQPGGSRRAALQPRTGRFRVVPARLSRSAEGIARAGRRNSRIGSLGNWPLNTTERWMRAVVTQDHSQERLDKLREIRLRILMEREQKKAARAPVVNSSSDSGDSEDSEEPETAGDGTGEGDEETERQKLKRRKLKKALRKKARRAKKRDTEWKRTNNRRRWQAAGRHGGIVARAQASVPALATRGDLVQLKEHADRVFIGKLVRCWSKVAEFFGVMQTNGDQEVPPPPCGDERHLSGDAAEFWKLLAGSMVKLTPEEAGVVHRRLEENAATKTAKGEQERRRGGDGDSATSDSILPTESGQGGGVNDEESSTNATATEKNRITYGQIYGALFRSEDLEALAEAFRREGDMRKKEERRMALKRQQFEDSMAERRSGAIAEVVKALSAGLGYRPSTKGKRRRNVPRADPNIDNGGSCGGDNDDNTNGDTASETTAGTVTTSASAATASSQSSGSNPAKDWWSDGGVSNRWAMSPAVRKTLFLSLQAGAVAHMSLKQRRALEVPWVKGVTHITLRRPKDALVACAKYGRDFYRLTAAQVVLALRAYAAQRIQAQWRGYGPRRRFAPKIVALRRLVKRERAIREARRRAAYGGWKVGHRARMELMRGTRRPFHVWRAESERLGKISALFRGTFWPLYVWRRWANYRVSSRDKAKFLRKVYLTSIILRHFRAWNKITESGQRVTVRGERASSARLKAKADRLFRWWAARMAKKKFLRRQWINGGMWLRLKVNTRQMTTAFVILRYWAFARAACTRRSDAHFRSYYLLGELDRRRALTEKRGGRQQQGRREHKGANKSKWHHSKRATSKSSSAHRSPGGADGNDSHDQRTSVAAAEDTNREPSDGAATGNGYDGSPKAHQRESNVGTLPKSEEEGGGNRTTAATSINPPIAVLGRPNHDKFPGLEDTYFGEGVEEGGATVACEILRSHFEKKEVLKARVNFLLYQRLAPQVLVRLRIKANERQRYRYAAYMDARRAQKKHLVAWHFAAVQMAALGRGITGEAMGMAMNSFRTETDQESQNNSSHWTATTAVHPLAQVVAGGGVFDLPGDRESEVTAASSADHAVVRSTGVLFGDGGGGGGDGGIARDSGGQHVDVNMDVNQLEEDRKTRRREVERTAARLSRLVDRMVTLKGQSAQDDENTAAWLSARQARERAVAKFLSREGTKARAADEKAKEFMAGFRHHAADNLVNVVFRIFNQVVNSRTSITLRKTMRQWRSWYMLRVSVHLYNRQRLRNWLQICVRLRYLWRGMPLFREQRVKWSVFHRLLELMDYRMRYGTPDLPAILRRRRELLLDYSCLLKERGFVPGRYAPEVLLPSTLDPLALIQRWKQYTQGRAASRFLGDSLRRRYLHRVARVAFDGWRTGLGPRQRREAAAMKAAVATAAAARSEASAATARPRRNTKQDAGVKLEEEVEEEEGKYGYDSGDGDGSVTAGVEAGGRGGRQHAAGEGSTQRRRQQKVSSIEARVLADLTVARRTVIAGWKDALTRAIGLRHAKKEYRLKKQSRRHPTFKKFMAFHTWQATERVRTEARLLVDAFLNRGRIKFLDQEPADIVGRSYEKGIGSGLIPFHDKPVQGSHLVCEVRVMTRVGEGVVGIQLVMTGGKRTVELPVHGAAAGENRSTRAHSFAVDAPVERLSRFQCEHYDGLIERLRVVTSGGRWSPWFGERLTAIPHQASLPDWEHHSLAATTSAAVLAAKKAAIAAARASLEEVSSADKLAAEVAATEAEIVAARAPAWDIQKEYITGLVGLRTHERLVGLGVITRHVTNSHVFSYLWEAPEEDAGTKNSESDGSSAAMPVGDTSFAPGGLIRADESVSNGGDSSISNTTLSPQKSSLPSAATPSGGRSSNGGGIGSSGHDSIDSTASSNGSSTLSRAEAKQQKFAQEMRDREKQSKERARLAREKEKEMERLLKGKNPKEEVEDDFESPSSRSPVAGAMGNRARPPPAPQKEFSSMLRMRRTDARHALERSVAMAHAARTYSANSTNGFDDAGGALSTLTVVVGLTKWLHSALLPQLVPLPVMATTTTDMFNRGEQMLFAARATEARGRKVKRAAERMGEARRKRGRRGVLSPTQRAQEIQDRENLVEWEAKAARLTEKARRQRDEGERLLDDARDRLPKVSQSVKTLRMYLEYLKLARRQIELEREFGLGALRTTKPAEGGQGGCHGNGVQPLPSGCGLEGSMFDATIKSLLHERQDNLGSEEDARGVDHRSELMPILSLTEEGPSTGLETGISSVNPWF